MSDILLSFTKFVFRLRHSSVFFKIQETQPLHKFYRFTLDLEILTTWNRNFRPEMARYFLGVYNCGCVWYSFCYIHFADFCIFSRRFSDSGWLHQRSASSGRGIGWASISKCWWSLFELQVWKIDWILIIMFYSLSYFLLRFFLMFFPI